MKQMNLSDNCKNNEAKRFFVMVTEKVMEVPNPSLRLQQKDMLQ
jgi:hypothetical protein